MQWPPPNPKEDCKRASWDPDLFFRRRMYTMYTHMASDPNHIGMTSLSASQPCDHVANGKGGGVHETDEFRMYAFKIRRCSKMRNHDWTECPYAHRGEKARRRDPRKHRYLGVACAEFRHMGECSKGQQCEFAHGVFEFWLHPMRYRTRPCKAGVGCQRRVCFFAHTPEQLRVKERDPKWWSCGWWPVAEVSKEVMRDWYGELVERMERLKLVDDGEGVESHAPPDIDWISELVK